MDVDWNVVLRVGGPVVGVLLAGMVFWRWFFSRPHLFKDYDGNFHTWHPGDHFTDANNQAVTDPKRIASLKKAWRDAYTAEP